MKRVLEDGELFQDGEGSPRQKEPSQQLTKAFKCLACAMGGGLGLLEGPESGPSEEVLKQPAECHRILNITVLLLNGDAKVKNMIVGTTYPQSLTYSAKSSQQD